MTYYFIDDFDNICRQKDGMDKDFAEIIDLIELINDTNKIQEENEQLQKQIKVYEYFLDQNDLDIDWNCLCTADECLISEDVDFDCKDCKYMELKE